MTCDDMMGLAVRCSRRFIVADNQVFVPFVDVGRRASFPVNFGGVTEFSCVLGYDRSFRFRQMIWNG
jgi:hypothetical protein